MLKWENDTLSGIGKSILHLHLLQKDLHVSIIAYYYSLLVIPVTTHNLKLRIKMVTKIHYLYRDFFVSGI